MRPAAVGLILIAALVAAGSSVRGLLSTTVVQILSLAILAGLVEWSRPNCYWRALNLLAVAIVGLPVLQLLPLVSVLAPPEYDILGLDLPHTLALTASWERTAEALLFVLPPTILFLVLSRFSEDDFNRLLPFFYLGFLANIVFGLVQFAARSGAELSPGFLPYLASAGFFANANHFASLMFVGIPLVIYQFGAVRRPLLSLVAVIVIVMASFATRSVAGVFLSVGCALVSYALVLRIKIHWRLLLVATAVAGMVVLSFNPGNVLEIRADDPLDRTSIWRNTLTAIGAYLPLGSGLGTFDLVYPGFEAASDIRTSFINHAHNEYLELLLEGGIAAGVLMLAYLVLLLLAMWRLPKSQLRNAAFCGISFLLIHSAVEYPLRNLSLALVFSVLNAIVFSTNVAVSRARQR